MKTASMVVAIALAFASPAAAQQLVSNGGFEAGNFSGFTQSGNTGFTGVSTAYAASGTYGAYFGPIGSVGGITQTLNTTAGQNYLISFDLANFQASDANFYEVLFGGTSLFTATNSSVFGFTNFRTTATALGATTNLAFNFRNDPNYFGLDNVSVTAVSAAVPEPATWAMMLVGFGAMGVAMRRQRASARPALA